MPVAVQFASTGPCAAAAGFRESVHVSQQNVFTGKLTPAMLRGVLERAKALAGLAI
jgi:uracil-DNA glycosylase